MYVSSIYRFHPIQMCNPANLSRANTTIDCWQEPGVLKDSRGGEVKLYTEEPYGSLAIGLLIGMCMQGYIA